MLGSKDSSHRECLETEALPSRRTRSSPAERGRHDYYSRNGAQERRTVAIRDLRIVPAVACRRILSATGDNIDAHQIPPSICAGRGLVGDGCGWSEHILSLAALGQRSRCPMGWEPAGRCGTTRGSAWTTSGSEGFKHLLSSRKLEHVCGRWTTFEQIALGTD